MKRPVVVLLVSLVLLAAAMIAARAFVSLHPPAPPLPALTEGHATPPEPWPAPDFAYPDQDQQTVTRQQLLGHVWIADFIFTQCRSACPLLTARMVLLQRQLARLGRPDVRFVSFSVDPEHDTPAALKAYAQKWHGDESRWRLLSTTAAALPATAVGLHVMVAKTTDAQDPIVHSSRFVLVGADGLVHGAYDSSDADDLKQLLADVAKLPAGAAVTAGAAALDHEPTSGLALYEALGCRGCHDRPEVAPRLGGIFGHSVALDDGRQVVADEAYVRESILAPAAAVVAGYGATMPSYAGQLGDRQLAALAGYVQSLPATEAPDEARRRVVDPVCKMDVSAGDSDPHADRDGRRYYFCSDGCRQKFLRDPARYAAAR